MQRGAGREKLVVVLPALALIAVEWALWEKRNELPGFGVEVDALALGVAFAVALLFGGVTLDSGAGWLDKLLVRMANAGIGSAGAAVCVFACGLVRLTLLELAPWPSVALTPLPFVRTAAIFVFGVGFAYGLATSLWRLGARPAFALGCATVLLAAVSIRIMSGAGQVPYESLRSEAALPDLLDDPFWVDVGARAAPQKSIIEARARKGVVVEREPSDPPVGPTLCTIHVLVDGEPVTSFYHYHHPEPHNQTCVNVTVRRSAVLGILSVSHDELLVKTTEIFLNGEPVDHVGLRDLEPSVMPPSLWSTVAVLGASAGALLLLLAAIEIARMRGLQRFVAAEHAGGGLVIMADDRRFSAAAAASLSPGGVMVRGELPADAGGDYRTRADLPGSAIELRSAAAHEDELDRRNDRVRAASLAAMTITFSSSVLLVAGWLLGFGH